MEARQSRDYRGPMEVFAAIFRWKLRFALEDFDDKQFDRYQDMSARQLTGYP